MQRRSGDLIKNMHEMKCKFLILFLRCRGTKPKHNGGGGATGVNYKLNHDGITDDLQRLTMFNFSVRRVLVIPQETLPDVARGGEGRAELPPLSRDTINDCDPSSSKNKDCFSIPPTFKPINDEPRGRAAALWY